MNTRQALSLWMEGAGPRHPLAVLDLPDDVLGSLDEILGLVERAQPRRIARRRQAFRGMTQLRELLEQRAELLAASLLVRSGVPFEFAADHPDLVMEGGRCGIEVTTRSLDDRRALHGLMELALQGRDLQAVLTFDGRPLKLGEATVDRVVEQVGGGVRRGQTSFRFEDIGLTVGVVPDVGYPDGQVVISSGAVTGSELTEHMAQVEREVGNAVVRKRRQAGAMPTVLLVDISRLGEAWLRPASNWTGALRRLQTGEPFVGLGVMLSSLTVSMPRDLAIVRGDDSTVFDEPFAAMTRALHLDHIELPKRDDAPS